VHPGEKLAELMRLLGYVHSETGEPNAEEFSRVVLNGAITGATIRHYLAKRARPSHESIHIICLATKAKPSIFFSESEEEVLNAGSIEEREDSSGEGS